MQKEKKLLRYDIATYALVLLLLCGLSSAFAQAPEDRLADLTISTTVTNRFVGVHGQRSVIMGYPQEGLEVWAYPLQILSRYQVGFRPEGSSSEVEGKTLLRRLIYAPDSVTRIYAGPDYVIREILFVPLDQPAAIIRYEVESTHNVDIVVHFSPVWNLMWPGAFGGQSTEWHAPASGYVLTEYAHKLSAVIGSLDVVTHDPTVNGTFNAGEQFSFTVHPHTAATGMRSSTVVVAQQQFEDRNSSATVSTLTASMERLQHEAAAHYAAFEASALRVRTPDADVNSAIAWAQIALDQSWVCNPQLGCGLVAGYGPSRGGRRPQYDWFFGGDGLVAVNALISASNYTRAREELEFIIKYQDSGSGMVWHELSQSAGYIDWAKYPYMFVHVDITFDYLIAVARYVEASGDKQFASDHWPSIANAYAYCRSIIRPADHLPHIPAGKEGGDEQNRPDDDLGLSSSWVRAAEGYAQLARTMGYEPESAVANSESQLAREAIAANYWNDAEHFWLDGHTVAGKPIFTRRSGFGAAIDEGAFTAKQKETLLDQIASSQFQTDWGARGAAADYPGYDPWSYTTASTSALQSSSLANLYWSNHRPDIAESIWRSIIPLNMLDAPGHLHEVLAGSLYLPGTESVPEQTWSSAGFLSATMKGLLGLEVHGAENALTFQPQLPADWADVRIESVALPHSQVALEIHQQMGRIELNLSKQGAPVPVVFEPKLPLGARVRRAECDGRRIPATIQRYAEEELAEIHFTAQSASTKCTVQTEGGVSLILPAPEPKLGDQTRGLRLTHLEMQGQHLLIDVEVRDDEHNRFRFRSSWRVADVKGDGSVTPLSKDLYEVRLDGKAPQADTSRQSALPYRKQRIEISFLSH